MNISKLASGVAFVLLSQVGYATEVNGEYIDNLTPRYNNYSAKVEETKLNFDIKPTVLADSPNLAAFSGLLLPGLIQGLDGQYTKAAWYATGAVGGFAIYGNYSDKVDFIKDDDRYDDDREVEYLNDTTLKADLASTVALNSMFMSAYDAYQSRAQYRGFNHGVTVSRKPVSELWKAPFEWNNLAKPSTYIPLLVVAAYVSSRDNVYAIERDRSVSMFKAMTTNFGSNMLTGVGEEAFFRGYLNTELSHQLGETPGVVASSLLFGAVHSGSGNQANFGMATAIGGYLGWLHQSNNYELDQGVALHYWINVISGIAELKHGGTVPIFQMNLPF